MVNFQFPGMKGKVIQIVRVYDTDLVSFIHKELSK